jgi:hypothetical protein
VLLGAMRGGVPLDLFTSGQARWLGVQYGNGPEQLRVLLLSVPYALKAADAETLGGRPLSDFMLKDAASTDTAAKMNSRAGGTSANGLKAQSIPHLTPEVTGSTPVTTAGGTVSYVPLWDSTSDINNSVIYQSGSNIGIGTTSPTAVFQVASGNIVANGTVTDSSTAPKFVSKSTDTVDTGGTYMMHGFYSQPLMTISSGVTNSGQLLGYFGQALRNYATTGDAGILSSLSAIQVQYGHYNYDSSASPTTTSAMGLFISPLFKSGTVSNAYDIYLGADQTGGAVTNEWGIFQAGTKNNYFGGNVGIGTTTPAAKLEVNGTAKFDSTVTFTGGQTFTGDGSGLTNLNPANISSGTAGISITGNAATAASATNAADLNGVPGSSYARLDIANSFTGNQAVNGALTTTGSVGIGTTTPTNPLTVIGAASNQSAVKGVGQTASTTGGSNFSSSRGGVWGDSASGLGIIASSNTGNAVGAINNVTTVGGRLLRDDLR